jgi:hypothetical protein
MGYGREFLKYNEQLPISRHKILRFNFKLLSMTHMVKVGFEYNLEVVSRTFESIAQPWSLMNLVAMKSRSWSRSRFASFEKAFKGFQESDEKSEVFSRFSQSFPKF